MKLDSTNLYVKNDENDDYVVCIELPDHSRNYIHSQKMVLGECVALVAEPRV